jgi:hypothetical protein
MTTHRVIFDLKGESGVTEGEELELIASTADAMREAQQMLFRAYRDRARITAFVTRREEARNTSRLA